MRLLGIAILYGLIWAWRGSKYSPNGYAGGVMLVYLIIEELVKL